MDNFNIEPQKEKGRFSLVKCVRKFKKKTLVSFYNKSNMQIKKKYIPFDYHGYRYRLDLETGALEYYDMKLCKYSSDCSVRRTKILLSMLLEMNTFDYFCTFTFDEKIIKSRSDEVIYLFFQKYMRFLRDKFPKLGYVTIPERHKTKYVIPDENVDYVVYFEDVNGVLHFHMLLKLNGYSLKDLGFKKTDKVCCSWATKKNGICSKAYYEATKENKVLTATDGLPIFNISAFPYGFTTASRIVSEDACKSYVKKYISKSIGSSTSKFKKRFYYSRNLDVPEVIKTEVGSDFDVPLKLENIKSISALKDFDEVVEYNDDVFSYYNKAHNVRQFWFDSDKYADFEILRHSGIIPTTKMCDEFKTEQELICIDNLSSEDELPF